jgi:hypothetical protein
MYIYAYVCVCVCEHACACVKGMVACWSQQDVNITLLNKLKLFLCIWHKNAYSYVIWYGEFKERYSKVSRHIY